MRSPADVIEALSNTNSRLEKEAVIAAAWQNNIREFFVGAQLALDTLVTFGVKTVPLIEDDDGTAAGSYNWNQFSQLANQLQQRSLTGHAARDALRAAAEVAPARDWNLWYRRLLLKDLKCGVTESTINKVLSAQGAEGKRFMVPVFACQLAKPADDHPKKMRGRKLLDRKYDGVRLLSVLDVSAGTVRQFTRDGREKTNFVKLISSLEKLLPSLKSSVVLDGEVISHNFQALMTQVNRKEDVDTSDSQLMLFDIVPLDDFRSGEYAVSQWDRHLALCELTPLLVELCDNSIHVEPKLEVNLDTPQGEAAMQEFNRQVLEEGLEGVMVKDPTAAYRCKRSDAWLKIKPHQTFDLNIVAVEEGQGKFEGMMGALICEGTDGDKFIKVNVGSGFEEWQRKDIWDNRSKMIGQVVEIKTDVVTKSADSDEIYSLRFPVFVRFRSVTMTPGSKD